MTYRLADGARLRLWHVAAGIAAAVAVAALVIAGVGRVAGYADLRDAVRGGDYRWLMLCALGQTAVFTGYAASLRRAVAAEGRFDVPLAASIRLVLASFAATQVFAFGGVAGLALVYWALRRVGMPRDEAAVRLIGLNTAVYLMFGALAWSSAAVALLRSSAPLGMTVPWLVSFPAVLLLARWFTAPRRVTRWTDAQSGALHRALGTGVGAAAWVRRSLNDRQMRPMFGWAALYWIGDVLSLWAALHAFGASPAIAALVLAYTTGYLAQSLPLPFIATGGVDAATAFLLQSVGVPLDLALAGIVAHRLFAFWLPVIPGAVFALTLHRLGAALDSAPPVGTAGASALRPDRPTG